MKKEVRNAACETKHEKSNHNNNRRFLKEDVGAPGMRREGRRGRSYLRYYSESGN